jgi:uncharacterized protein
MNKSGFCLLSFKTAFISLANFLSFSYTKKRRLIMRKFVYLAFILMIVSILILCNGKEDEPKVDKDFEQLAKEFTNLLMEGKYDDVHSTFDQRMASAMSLNDLKTLWEQTIKKTYGEPTDIVNIKVEEITSQGEKFIAVYVTLSYLKNPEDLDSIAYFILRIIYRTQGEVAGLWFKPAEKPDESDATYSPPDYVDSEAFTEEELNLELDGCVMNGVLSIPKGGDSFPVVILVHGSGPHDMDETIGLNKPFKDIAQGLASMGVATLRYDKRTYACKDLVAKNMYSLTTYEEVVDDAVSYTRMLVSHERIDSNRIFIGGHSLGGMLAPRIAKTSTDVDGIISLAGTNSNLADETLRQTEYIINLDGEVTPEEKEQLDSIKQSVDKINSGDIGEDEIVLGGSKAYWEDLLSYDPVETAQSLDIPMLFIQGERDYQVRMVDFNRWKEALSDKDDVNFISYPQLNHLLLKGEGKPNPYEYYNNPGHVAKKIIEDMANWIK